MALGGQVRRDLRLPTYPFQHRRYWHQTEVDAARAGLHGVTRLDLPLLARRFTSPLVPETLFETELSRKATPFIEDHRVFGQLVVAGAAHLSMVLSAAALTDLAARGSYSLTDVLFPMALTIPEEGERIVQLALGPTVAASDTPGTLDFRLVSLQEKGREPALHAKGHIAAAPAPAATPDLRAIWQRCAEDVAVAAVFELQSQRHIVVGPSYQWLTALRRGAGETVACFSAPPALAAVLARYALHPGLIDSCFGAMVMAQTMDIEESFIPFSLEALHFYRPSHDLAAEPLLAHARVRLHDETRMVGDIHLYSDQGEPIAAFIGLEGRRASRHALLAGGAGGKPQPAAYAIEWQALVLAGAAVLADRNCLLFLEGGAD
ncbi:MAG: polyketide synthase dehydratase domain-containing protein, partial [Proteobacteria bacterium]|nr:polyketide synthase dehydratase domain-containing protein [Pseudomonadota bacterium]